MEIINWLRTSTKFYSFVACKADNNSLGDIICQDLVWDSNAFGVQSTVDNDEQHVEMVAHIADTADLEQQYDTIIEQKWSKDWGGWTYVDNYFDPTESSVSKTIINEPQLDFEDFSLIFEAITEDDDYIPFVAIRIRRSDDRIYTFFVDNEADVRGGYYVETTDTSPALVEELIRIFE